MIRHISPPARDTVADLDLAIGARRGEGVRRLLKAARSDVVAAYRLYDDSRCSDMVPIFSAPPELLEALRSNYELTRGNGRLSDLRDDVLAGAFNGLCAMCDCRQAGTLDHVLPKQAYPEFSIYSLNLVPACERCNLLKSTVEVFGGTVLHCYFDRHGAPGRVLRAAVEIDDGLVINFSIDQGIDGKLATALHEFFARLQLAELYSTAAALELFERFEMFVQDYADGGPRGVSSRCLAESARFARRMGENYFKVALYEALSLSESFCEGAFELIDSK